MGRSEREAATRIGLRTFAQGVPLPDALVEIEDVDRARSVRAIEVVTGSYTHTGSAEEVGGFTTVRVAGMSDRAEAASRVDEGHRGTFSAVVGEQQMSFVSHRRWAESSYSRVAAHHLADRHPAGPSDVDRGRLRWRELPLGPAVGCGSRRPRAAGREPDAVRQTRPGALSVPGWAD